MNIISNNYEKILKDMIFSKFYEELKKELDKNIVRNNIFNYIDLLSKLDNTLCEIAKTSLISIIEAIDKSYSNSIERKAKYYIKAHRERTILTIFGEITYKRTFYSDKNNEGCFCYVDKYLGLKKYDYFDPYLKATILEYAANNSAPTVCKMINDLIGKRIKLVESFKYISRQTIRNIILESKFSKVEEDELEIPENESIYIMADEKFVATQNNDNKDVMIKSIVVFDGITGEKRKTLNNKKIFAGYQKGLVDNVLDYLYYVYDLDKLKNIFVMGDGAKWIRHLTGNFQINKDTNVIFALDHYHFKQATHHIGLEKDYEDVLNDYIKNNDKENFSSCCDELCKSFPHRAKTITTKKEYIINNFKNIQNLLKYNLSCPMESQISHNLAYLFSSRPKGYSIKTLEKLIPLRMLYKNNKNIKYLYLNNINVKEVKTIKKEHLNFNLKQFLPHIEYERIIPNYTYSQPYDSSYHCMA
ncbi:MAG: UPF0236 family protein [Bacilli bacterium]